MMAPRRISRHDLGTFALEQVAGATARRTRRIRRQGRRVTHCSLEPRSSSKCIRQIGFGRDFWVVGAMQRRRRSPPRKGYREFGTGISPLCCSTWTVRPNRENMVGQCVPAIRVIRTRRKISASTRAIRLPPLITASIRQAADVAVGSPATRSGRHSGLADQADTFRRAPRRRCGSRTGSLQAGHCMHNGRNCLPIWPCGITPASMDTS